MRPVSGMRPVLTKLDFTRRYQVGEFGNAAPTWLTYDDFRNSWWSLYIHERFNLRSSEPGGRCIYDLSATDVFMLYGEGDYISCMCPTERTTFQGEVARGTWGYDLTGTWVRRPMREALKVQCEFIQGLRAKLILDKYMNDLSRQWLDVLLERYPDHVVEFTCLSTCWGTVPGHNTVFWEVRKY